MPICSSNDLDHATLAGWCRCSSFVCQQLGVAALVEPELKLSASHGTQKLLLPMGGVALTLFGLGWGAVHQFFSITRVAKAQAHDMAS